MSLDINIYFFVFQILQRDFCSQKGKLFCSLNNKNHNNNHNNKKTESFHMVIVVNVMIKLDTARSLFTIQHVSSKTLIRTSISDCVEYNVQILKPVANKKHSKHCFTGTIYEWLIRNQ